MRIVQRMRAAWLAALLALAGCGGGFAIYFGDGDWPVALTVVAPTRIETGQVVDLRPGGLSSYGGLRFEWDFGDGGSFRFEAQPTYPSGRAGSYTVVRRVSDDDETLSASLRVEVGAWSNVEGRSCTGPGFSGWCQQPAPGSGADIDGLWFFDSRQGLARDAGGGLWRAGDGGRNWAWVGPTARARFAPDG
ncbi:MAG: PKD domain-containing protein, partial [Burkholderiales bacterium]|nr:PKD domain-containing protein [Burkholderiales bacterium]